MPARRLGQQEDRDSSNGARPPPTRLSAAQEVAELADALVGQAGNGVGMHGIPREARGSGERGEDSAELLHGVPPQRLPKIRRPSKARRAPPDRPLLGPLRGLGLDKPLTRDGHGTLIRRLRKLRPQVDATVAITVGAHDVRHPGN